jgi:chorismate mutase/prephenate dehydrogenase
MIDALDRDLLQSWRAGWRWSPKSPRTSGLHSVRIRDPRREREVLDDRRERARELGLPVGEIESIFRVLLRSSRDHQAALRAEVPVDDEPRTVAIIGGHGQMGALFSRLFGDLGHRLLIVDLDTELCGRKPLLLPMSW